MDEVQNGYRYRDPAPQTLKFMEEQIKFNQHFELGMNDMKNSIKSLDEKLDQNAKEHKQIMDKIDLFLTGCDQKYASKSFETIAIRVSGAVGLIILGAIATAIFRLIFK
jgi:hypothetical protein